MCACACARAFGWRLQTMYKLKTLIAYCYLNDTVWHSIQSFFFCRFYQLLLLPFLPHLNHMKIRKKMKKSYLFYFSCVCLLYLGCVPQTKKAAKTTTNYMNIFVSGIL